MPPQTAPVIIRDTWVDHPKGRIFARIWDSAEQAGAAAPTPIVLFHDSLGCVDLWRGFPLALSERTGRTVIAYDRLGFGKSSPRQDMPSLDFVAEEADVYFPVLRAQLALDRFVAFGHSVGGGMAIHCAAAFPDCCEALITESAQTFLEDRTRQSIAAAREQFRDESQRARLRPYHGDKADWVLRAWTGSWLHPDFASWTLAPVLPQVRCPVLVIHGIYDEYGSVQHPEMIGQLTTGPVRVEILPDTYHVPHREREGKVIDMVAAFLATLPQT